MPSIRTLGRQIIKRLDRLRTSQAAQAVYKDRLTYLNPTKMRRLERAARTAMSAAPGSVVEFGIALGGSAIVLAGLARGQGRVFHGFDIFGMIPPPTSEKDDEAAKARYQVIAAGKSAGIRGDLYYGYREDLYGDVCRAFERHGIPVDGNKVHLHQGLFEDSLKDFPVARSPLPIWIVTGTTRSPSASGRSTRDLYPVRSSCWMTTTTTAAAARPPTSFSRPIRNTGWTRGQMPC